MRGDFSPAGMICGQGSPSSCMCVMDVSSFVNPACTLLSSATSRCKVETLIVHLHKTCGRSRPHFNSG